MSDKENLDAVMRRIEKLLAIASCEGANPNEAAAAAGMAERIMRKFQLEHSDIIKASLLRGDDMEDEVVIASAKTNGTRIERVPVWAQIIASAISDLCEVGIRYGVGKAPKFHIGVRFFGFSSDVKMAAWMYSYLTGVVNSLCIEFKNSPSYKWKGRSAMNDYRFGVSSGISMAIRKLISEKEFEKVSTGTDLVIIKKNAIAERFGKSANTKEVRDKNGEDVVKGIRDGVKVDLNCRGLEVDERNLLEKRPGI